MRRTICMQVLTGAAPTIQSGRIWREQHRPGSSGLHPIPEEARMALFDETYRVVAVNSQSLTVRGTLMGEILSIVNTNPEMPLTEAEYPLGQLIALSVPSAATSN